MKSQLPNETLTNKNNLTQIFTSFNNLGKNIDLNTELIAREQDTDAVIKIVKELVRNKNKDSKIIHYRQSKALSSYLNKFELLSLLGKFFCIEQTSDNPEVKEIKICVPMSLFIKLFELAHTDQLAGHVGKDKTIANIKRFFFWPGMYKWITQLIAGCLDCQKNEHKRHDLNQAPLEQWTDTVPFPFHNVHIDHTGPINSTSNGKKHCLVVVDSFYRFLQVYPVANTTAFETIKTLEKFILTFGIPQKLVYDKGTAFMNEDFTSWLYELGITHAPRTPEPHIHHEQMVKWKYKINL